jgi:hypothetical protein
MRSIAVSIPSSLGQYFRRMRHVRSTTACRRRWPYAADLVVLEAAIGCQSGGGAGAASARPDLPNRSRAGSLALARPGMH